MPIAVNDVNTQSHSVKVGIADAYYYDYGGYTSRCCRSQPKARCQHVSPMICPLSTIVYHEGNFLIEGRGKCSVKFSCLDLLKNF